MRNFFLYFQLVYSVLITFPSLHLACLSGGHLTLLVKVYMRLLFVLTTNFILIFQESDRVVTKKEGINFARESGCLFIECSAKTRVNVQQCFEELVLKVWKYLNHCNLIYCVSALICCNLGTESNFCGLKK